MHSDYEHISDSITAFLTERMPMLPQTYQFPVPANVPFEGYRPQGGTLPEQQLNLRCFLSRRWQSSGPEERFRIAQWYVRDWGGIRRNKEERLKRYAFGEFSDLVAEGLTGIASWSKVLAVRDSEQFAIYDARVVASLNAVQFVYGGALKWRFDQIPGQNTQIQAFWSRLRQVPEFEDVRRVPPAEAYQVYLTLLRRQRALRPSAEHWHNFEMALFADAERLASQVFPVG